MNKRSFIRRILPLLIIVLAVSVAFSMVSSKPQRKKPQPSEKVWHVDVMPARIQQLSPSLKLYGVVETPSLLKAAAPGDGLLTKVRVQSGDRVKPGQLLVEMDRRDFLVGHLQASADVDDIRAQISEQELKYQANLKALAQEKALLKLAQNEVQRVERLKNKNLSSESALSAANEMLGKQQLAMIAKQLEVDRYNSTTRQLSARLARARARVQQTQLALDRSKIEAGFEGVIAEVAVAEGDRVRGGDMLVSLYALDSLQVRASLPARYQNEIQQALKAGVELHANAELSGHPVQLTLLRLAGEASLSGIDAYFSIDQGGAGLRMGNLLKLDLQRPLQSGVIAVPFTSIYGNNRVFVLREGRMESIDVEAVGQLDNSQGRSSLLIRSELIQPGDQIITTHLPNAVDGLKVKVAEG